MKKTKADLEDGYTRIANSLLEALYKTPILSRESRVLLFIIRQTYGFGHKSRELSNGFIAAGTGINAKHISEIIKGLVSANVLTKEQAQGRKPQIIGINTQLEKWNTIPKFRDNTIPKFSVPKNGDSIIPKSGDNTIPKSGDEINKDINKDIKESEGGSFAAPAHALEIFERLWNEWEFSKLGKDRVPKRTKTEIENIGYLRMHDAKERYEYEFRTKTTKNNQPLSARTWFSEAYKYYLPTVDENGFWTDSEGKEYKHINGKDVLIE